LTPPDRADAVPAPRRRRFDERPGFVASHEGMKLAFEH